MKPLLERLLDMVHPEPMGGCWLWTGAVAKGYGIINVGNKMARKAHRVSYELHVGSIPHGLHLDHKCRVRCCVNPDHLEPVTQQENIRRGEAGKKTGAINRAKTHCPRGHTYSDAYIVEGRRVCRTCSLLRAKARQSGGKYP